MEIHKGDTLKFKERSEVVIKANNDTIRGSIQTGNNTYSTDFIQRWISFGFVTVIKNK